MLIQSFRESDVIARIGSHEFAALAVDASENGSDSIDKRLRMNLNTFIKKKSRPFILSLNFRTMYCNPDEYLLIEKTLFEADEMMLLHLSGLNN
ncbi:MAG: diguanylate cyclase [Candidatus Marinimicrobia bacterium]|nr:diguanylate cyclase [Candidatus Neomarinimicrobiota bacterium]